MPFDYALTTKEKVKTFLEITVADFDDLIDDLIDHATDFMETQMGGRRIKEYEWTDEFFDGGRFRTSTGAHTRNTKRNIFVRNYPITELLKVEERLGDHVTGTFDDVAATDYIEYPDVGKIHFPVGTITGNQNYRITYKAGFQIIPADLELACIEYVAREFDQRKAQGKMEEQVEGMRITWNTMLNKQQIATLRAYRRIFGYTSGKAGEGAVVVPAP